MNNPHIDLSSKLMQLSSYVDAYGKEGAKKTEIQEKINTIAVEVLDHANERFEGGNLKSKIELLSRGNIGPLVTKIKDFYNDLQVFPKAVQAFQQLEADISSAVRMKDLNAQVEPGAGPERAPENLDLYEPGAPIIEGQPQQVVANAIQLAAQAPKESTLTKVASFLKKAVIFTVPLVLMSLSILPMRIVSLLYEKLPVAGFSLGFLIHPVLLLGMITMTISAALFRGALALDRATTFSPEKMAKTDADLRKVLGMKPNAELSLEDIADAAFKKALGE